MDLSIIVVSWNTKDLLAQCLHALEEQTETFKPSAAGPRSNACPERSRRVETFVVDNASTDGSAAMIRKHFPEVHLLQNDENLGFAAANNQGIRQSTGRYILLLNSDTKVHEDTLTSIVRFFDQVPTAGVVGARLLNPDSTLQYYPTKTLTLIRLLTMLWRLPGHQSLWRGVTGAERPRLVERVKGACMALRRSAVEHVGLMAEDFFLYAEEDDWCLRFLRSSWDIYYLPSATVTHQGAASTRQMTAQARIHLYQSRVAYLRRHFGRLQAILYKIAVASTYLGKLLQCQLLRLTRKGCRGGPDTYRDLIRALRNA